MMVLNKDGKQKHQIDCRFLVWLQDVQNDIWYSIKEHVWHTGDSVAPRLRPCCSLILFLYVPNLFLVTELPRTFQKTPLPQLLKPVPQVNNRRRYSWLCLQLTTPGYTGRCSTPPAGCHCSGLSLSRPGWLIPICSQTKWYSSDEDKTDWSVRPD